MFCAADKLGKHKVQRKKLPFSLFCTEHTHTYILYMLLLLHTYKRRLFGFFVVVHKEKQWGTFAHVVTKYTKCERVLLKLKHFFLAASKSTENVRKEIRTH